MARARSLTGISNQLAAFVCVMRRLYAARGYEGLDKSDMARTSAGNLSASDEQSGQFRGREQMLRRRAAGQLAEVAHEVRLVGIAACRRRAGARRAGAALLEQ